MGKAVSDYIPPGGLVSRGRHENDWLSSKSKFAAGARVGRSLAHLDGYHSASIDYRPSRAREGLATLRRQALDIQEIRRV